MQNKEDFIAALRSDELYKRALARAKDDRERAAISHIVETMVGNFAQVLVPALVAAKNDPAFVEQLKRALAGASQVVSSEEVPTKQ